MNSTPIYNSNTPIICSTSKRTLFDQINNISPKKYKPDSVETRVNGLQQKMENKLIEIKEFNSTCSSETEEKELQKEMKIKLVELKHLNAEWSCESVENELSEEMENKFVELEELNNSWSNAKKIKEINNAITTEEQRFKVLCDENQTLSNNLEHFFLEKFETLNSIEDFRSLQESINHQPTAQKIWEKTLKKRDNSRVTFSFTSSQGNKTQSFTVTLPLSLWKAHSNLFKQAALSPMQKNSFLEDISIDSLQQFIQCLEQCSSSKNLSRETLQDLWTLADKYQISWLSKECGDFFDQVYKPFQKISQEIENLSIAAKCQQPAPVSSSIVSLCNLWETIKINDLVSVHDKTILKAQLVELADEFELADIKLFMTCDHVEILPNKSFSVSIIKSDFYEDRHYNSKIEMIKKILKTKNNWYSPQIELNMSPKPIAEMRFPCFQGIDEVLYVLEEVLKEANLPITLKIGPVIPQKFNEILEKTPLIHHLRILFDCKEALPDAPLKIVKENTTLKSLHLTIDNYDNGEAIDYDKSENDSEDDDDFKIYWPEAETDFLENEEKRRAIKFAGNEISENLKINDQLRSNFSIPYLQILFIQSNISVDKNSQYKFIDEKSELPKTLTTPLNRHPSFGPLTYGFYGSRRNLKDFESEFDENVFYQMDQDQIPLILQNESQTHDHDIQKNILKELKTLQIQQQMFFPESLQMFIRWLEEGRKLEEVLNEKNIQDLWVLANQYKIKELSKVCGHFFEDVIKPLQDFSRELENLSIVANFSQPSPVSSSIISLCKIWETLRQSDKVNQDEKAILKTKLEKLADEFQLANLKLFITCNHVKILPNQSFSICIPLNGAMNVIQIEGIQKCLAIKNSWYSPQIEIEIEQKNSSYQTRYSEREAYTFHYSGTLFEDSEFKNLQEFSRKINHHVFSSLKEILEYAEKPLTLKFTGDLSIDFGGDDVLYIHLDEILNKIPTIKHLRLSLGCFSLSSKTQPPQSLFEMIEKNTYLKSFHLTINNYYDEDNVNFDEYLPGANPFLCGYDSFTTNEIKTGGWRDLKIALKSNERLRANLELVPLQTIIIQSIGQIDPDSTYTNKICNIIDDFQV